MDLQPTPLPPRFDWPGFFQRRLAKIIGGGLLAVIIGLGAWWAYSASKMAGEVVVTDSSLTVEGDQAPLPATRPGPVTTVPTSEVGAGANDQPTKDNDGAPTVVGGPTVGDSADADRDGLPDALEKEFSTDSKKSDSDGDGYSDIEEVKNGYDPLGAVKLWY
ncbi:MAG: hypothetical protein AAB817_01565, partial [Patescibacteria group bacterium]